VSSLLSLSLQEAQVKDSAEIKAVTCSHSSFKSILANGKIKGVQRYDYNGCNKNLSETTGKFWHSIKKRDKHNRYLYYLLSGYSIVKSAKETGISIRTSFDWCHKLPAAFSSVSVAKFPDIVESDDLFLAYSEKGNRHLDRKPKKRG
jgi:transposase-like protein